MTQAHEGSTRGIWEYVVGGDSYAIRSVTKETRRWGTLSKREYQLLIYTRTPLKPLRNLPEACHSQSRTRDLLPCPYYGTCRYKTLTIQETQPCSSTKSNPSPTGLSPTVLNGASPLVFTTASTFVHIQPFHSILLLVEVPFRYSGFECKMAKIRFLLK